MDLNGEMFGTRCFISCSTCSAKTVNTGVCVSGGMSIPWSSDSYKADSGLHRKSVEGVLPTAFLPLPVSVRDAGISLLPPFVAWLCAAPKGWNYSPGSTHIDSLQGFTVSVTRAHPFPTAGSLSQGPNCHGLPSSISLSLSLFLLLLQ